MSDSLWPHGLQHARLPSISLSLGVCSNSCPIESVIPSNHLSLCCPLFFLPSVFPSMKVFTNESALHIRQPKYWSFSFSISLSNEYSRLISFRIDQCNLLAVQGRLKSLLQHHNLRVSVLWCSDFFMVQISHPYRATGKTIALTIQTFVGKAAFTIHSDLGAQGGKKIWHCFYFAPLYLPWSDGSQRVGHNWATELNWTDGTRCRDLRFLNVVFFFFFSVWKRNGQILSGFLLLNSDT